AASAHWRFHGAADPQPRSAELATAARGDRPHAGSDGQGDRAELMPSLGQRAFCEWLGTAFLLCGVSNSPGPLPCLPQVVMRFPSLENLMMRSLVPAPCPSAT